MNKKDTNKYPFMDMGDLNNAEIEGKESILLPDGRSYMVKGKSHSNGGIDLFLPQESKVFSHHLKLPKDIVGILLDDEKNTKKMSPAEISKKYDTLPYHDMLTTKVPRYDDLSKKTAALMVSKLNGIQEDIFLAQEEYKNEKGIDKNTPIMKNGGLYDFNLEFQNGGTPQNIIDDSLNMKNDDVISGRKNQITEYHKREYLKKLARSKINEAHDFASLYANMGNLQDINGNIHRMFENISEMPLNRPANINDAYYELAPKMQKEMLRASAVQPTNALNSKTRRYMNGGELPKYQNGIYFSGDGKINRGLDYLPDTFSGSNTFQTNPSYANPQTNRYGVRPLFFEENISANNYLDGQQRKNKAGLYDGINNYSSQHVEWMKHNNPDTPLNQFQNKHSELFQNSFKVDPRYDFGADPRDNKYGVNTAGQPLTQVDLSGSAVGSITLPEYKADREGAAKKYGVNPETLDQMFNDNQVYQVNVGRNNLDPLATLPERPRTLLTSDPEPLNIPNQPEQNKLEQRVPVGMDYRDYVNGIQNGLLLSQLATLEVENPYYRFSPSKIATTRFEPVNTKQSERAFNIAKESLENSNVPESVKNAQLAQMQATLQGGINQVDITNYQGNLQNQNKNTSNLLNTLNSDSQRRDQDNLLYLQDRANGSSMYQKAKNDLVVNALDNWKATLQNKRDEQLISQLFNNYNIGRNGEINYTPGQGFQNPYNNLNGYTNNTAAQIAQYEAELKRLKNLNK